MNPETNIARTQVMPCFVGFEAKIPQQSRQQGKMDLLVRRFGFIESPALLAHQRHQLTVNVMPFAQSQR